MLSFAISILLFLFFCALAGAGLGLLLVILKVILSIPHGLYVGSNRYRLKKEGYDVDSKEAPSFKELLKFYARALTFRRPLIP